MAVRLARLGVERAESVPETLGVSVCDLVDMVVPKTVIIGLKEGVGVAVCEGDAVSVTVVLGLTV